MMKIVNWHFFHFNLYQFSRYSKVYRLLKYKYHSLKKKVFSYPLVIRKYAIQVCSLNLHLHVFQSTMFYIYSIRNCNLGYVQNDDESQFNYSDSWKSFLGKENDEQALFVLLLLLPNCQPKLKIILSTKLEESLWFLCLFYLF